MKKYLKSIVVALGVAAFGLNVGACARKAPQATARGGWQIVSPDNSVSASLDMDKNGALSYSIKKGNTAVVEKSALGFSIAQDDLRIFTVDGASMRRVTGEYDNEFSGKHSHVEYDCNELTLTLKSYEYYLDVIMRVYDDGYAFKYNIRSIDGAAGEIEVVEEESEFTIPTGSTVWTQVYESDRTTSGFFSYEKPYVRRSVNNLYGDVLAMPLLYRVKGTDCYSLITESQLVGSGYYGSFLAQTEENSGTGKFNLVHSPATENKNDNKIEVPFSSPWRTGIVGDMKTVIESELVEKLYDDVEYWKPDNYDELSSEQKEIYDYEWVDTGLSAWNWLAAERKCNPKLSQSDYSVNKLWVDLARDMGWTYVVLDAGWDNSFDKDVFTDFISYADECGIKVMVWCDAYSSFAHNNREVLSSLIGYWAELGIDGIKIDFFDGLNAQNSPVRGEDIGSIEWYETVFQVCAENKMVVNCHGCNKPTGIRRKYPNVINYEGIKGNEVTNVDSLTTVNSLFTRAVIGPTDFTPFVTPSNNGVLTVAHHMALAALYESGAPSMADLTEQYYNDDFNDYYKSLGALRDDTVFISGEPDWYYCAAVRYGDDWIVAGVNTDEVTEINIDFDFLGDGEYSVTSYSDVELEEKRNTDIVKKTDNPDVTRYTDLSVVMYNNGGFVLHLKKL